MYITEIEFTGFDGDLCTGSVTLVAGDTRMQIPLTLERRQEMDETRTRLLLLAAAIAQARRVPDYRGKLKFAPGVLPPELTRRIAVPAHVALARRRMGA